MFDTDTRKGRARHMHMIETNGVRLHVADDGPRDGFPVVFSNSLGTDLRLWDQMLPLLPDGLRLIRYDKRGHGLSDCPLAPYHMGDLVKDAAGVMETFGVNNALFVGLSIGGIIAQGLAAERPDLVRAIVLADTAAKIGTLQMWADRVTAVRAGGIEALEAATMERWFSKDFLKNRQIDLAAWRHMLCRTPAEGYVGCSQAISETDLIESTSRLSLPTLAIVGYQDGATPPDLVRETANLIPGSRFEIIQGAGHLPCVEHPKEMARLITNFMEDNNLG